MNWALCIELMLSVFVFFKGSCIQLFPVCKIVMFIFHPGRKFTTYDAALLQYVAVSTTFDIYCCLRTGAPLKL